jgi:hypothetical protein
MVKGRTSVCAGARRQGWFLLSNASDAMRSASDANDANDARGAMRYARDACDALLAYEPQA